MGGLRWLLVCFPFSWERMAAPRGEGANGSTRPRALMWMEIITWHLAAGERRGGGGKWQEEEVGRVNHEVWGRSRSGGGGGEREMYSCEQVSRRVCVWVRRRGRDWGFSYILEGWEESRGAGVVSRAPPLPPHGLETERTNFPSGTRWHISSTAALLPSRLNICCTQTQTETYRATEKSSLPYRFLLFVTLICFQWSHKRQYKTKYCVWSWC